VLFWRPYRRKRSGKGPGSTAQPYLSGYGWGPSHQEEVHSILTSKAKGFARRKAAGGDSFCLNGTRKAGRPREPSRLESSNCASIRRAPWPDRKGNLRGQTRPRTVVYLWRELDMKTRSLSMVEEPAAGKPGPLAEGRDGAVGKACRVTVPGPAVLPVSRQPIILRSGLEPALEVKQW
jgi:hypothetical protein